MMKTAYSHPMPLHKSAVLAAFTLLVAPFASAQTVVTPAAASTAATPDAETANHNQVNQRTDFMGLADDQAATRGTQRKLGRTVPSGLIPRVPSRL